MKTLLKIELISKLTNPHLEKLQPDDIKAFVYEFKNYLHFRYGKKIICYEISDKKNKIWSQAWEVDIFSTDHEHDKQQYPWFITDKLQLGDYQIIVKTELGLKILKVSKSQVSVIATDEILHDVYGYSLPGHEVMIGNIYPDLNKIGLTVRDLNNATVFYALDKNTVITKPRKALLKLRKKLQILSQSAWTNYINIYLVDLHISGPQSIVLRTTTGFDFYSFNSSYDLVNKSKCSCIFVESEKVLFGNVTNIDFSDILIFNKHGLFIYKWNKNMNEYFFFSFHGEFSLYNGWNVKLYGRYLHLFDINQDKRDELVVSDQFGIITYSFGLEDHKWNPILISFDETKFSKFSDILALTRDVLTNDTYCIIYEKNNDLSMLKMSQVDQSEANENAYSKEDQKRNQQRVRNFYDIPKNISALIPLHETIAETNEKPILYWTQKYDSTAIFKDIIHPITGQVKFTLPLVSIPYDLAQTIDFYLSYDGSSYGDNLIGVGWSTNIKPEFISINHRGSVFEQDHVFIINIDGKSIPLTFEIREGDNYKFKIDSDPQIKSIIYNKNSEVWKFESKDETKAYGGKPNSESTFLHQSLAWENWEGSGTDVNSLKPVIIGWYLREQQSQLNIMHFCYTTIENKSLPRKRFTSEVLLTKIHNTRDIVLTFSYKKKQQKEFIEPTTTDSNGKYRFPILQASTYYMSGYYIKSKSFEQCIQFNYLRLGNVRLLSQIQQMHKGVSLENILNFKYNQENSKVSITEITLPTELKIQLQYQELTVNQANKNKIIKYPVTKNFQITNGLYFMLMSDTINSDKSIRLRILDEKYKFLLSQVLISSESKILNFKQNIVDENIIIIIFTDQHIKIRVVEKINKIWEVSFHEKLFHSKTISTVGSDFIALSEPGSNTLNILTWDSINRIFIENSISVANILRLDSNNNNIAAYNDQNVFIIYKKNDQWNNSVLKTEHAGFLAASTETINKFDINERTKDIIINQNIDFQLFGNTVILTKLLIVNNVFYKEIAVLILDAYYKIFKIQTFKVGFEDLFKIHNTQIHDDMILTYGLTNKMYQIKIKDLIGKNQDLKKIGNQNLRTDEKLRRIARYENSLKEQFEKIVLLDMKKYFIQITPIGILTGENYSLWQYNGIEFIENTIPKFVYKLKSDVTLEEDTRTLFKINMVSEGKINTIHQLTLYDQALILNRYPIYIAYQNVNNDLQLISFNENVVVNYNQTFKGETFLHQSDYYSLLSKSLVLERNNAELYQINIRNSDNFFNTYPTTYVSKIEYTDNTSPRITSFERQYLIDKNYKTEIKVLLIPEGKKELSGYTEISLTKDKNATEWKETFSIYNSDSTLEGKEEKAPIKKNQNEDSNVDTFIMDKSNRLILVDTKPYRSSDQIVGFFGFEGYEISENVTLWQFNLDDIRSNAYSYTGNNILRLSKSNLSATITPPMQEGQYYISSYIRTDIQLRVGGKTNLLKSKILIDDKTYLITLESTIRKVYNKWALLQIEINFRKLQAVFRAYLDYNGKTFHTNQVVPKFSINIVISPFENEVLEVDNIAFYPKDFDFKAIVYDESSGKPTAVINYKEAVTRYIYDHYDNEVLAFRDDGSEMQLVMLHLTGYSRNISQSKPHISVFSAPSGFHEVFDEYSFQTRWCIKNSNSWKISHSVINYKGTSSEYLKLNENLIQGASYLVKFKYEIFESSKLTFLFLEIKRDIRSKTILTCLGTQVEVNNIGYVSVLTMQNRVVVWYDNLIVKDESFQLEIPSPRFIFTGELKLEDVIFLIDPAIKIEYRNKWGEKQQIVSYVAPEEIVTFEVLYDAQGRDAVTTKLSKIIAPKKLLTFNDTYISLEDIKQFWTHGKLKGDIAKLNPNDGELSYSRKVYNKNPKNEISIIGLPGIENCISCKYKVKLSYKTKNHFINNFYPQEKGYYIKEEEYSDKRMYINVFDTRKNLVAIYNNVNNFDHLLSTYEYNDNNQVTKILPPIYHDEVRTFAKLREQKITKSELDLQQKLAHINIYGSNGKLHRNKNPDSGDREYLYNSNLQLKWIIYYHQNSNFLDSATYFQYNESNQLEKTSYIHQNISRAELLKNSDIDKVHLQNLKEFQTIFIDRNPTNSHETKLMKKFISITDNVIVVDELEFDSFDNLVEKRVFVTSAEKIFEFSLKSSTQDPNYKSIKYQCKYKGADLQINYSYDKLGHLIMIDFGVGHMNFVKFRYNGSGQILSESFFEDTKEKYVRTYVYNSPGYLLQISDTFVSQSLTYASDGYGQTGRGDGLVMSSRLNMKWLKNIDERFMRLHENDLAENPFKSFCFESLKNLKYIDSSGVVLRELLPNLEVRLPLVCRGKYELHLSSILSQFLVNNDVEYKYSYGNHKELIRSKRTFIDPKFDSSPLSIDTFYKEVTNITLQESKEIFNILVDVNAIITDRTSYEEQNVLGKQGTSIFRIEELTSVLYNMGDKYSRYARPIINLIVVKFVMNEKLTRNEFSEIYFNWNQPNTHISNVDSRTEANLIFNMLLFKHFVTYNEPYYFGSVLSHVKDQLSKYSYVQVEIIRTLISKFLFAIGSSIYDLESYNIDSNGNHRLFYLGFTRYHLDYQENSNKLKTVTMSSPYMDDVEYIINHDSKGNIVKAPHLGIENISYHPVTQRPTVIAMNNGKLIKFSYDAKGERVLKEVYDQANYKIKEIFYVRNEKGQVLFDKCTYFQDQSSETSTIVETVYLYGERGLLGFIRDNQIYTVFTDHGGSVKLVILKKQVIAAFEYLPYGRVFQKYGNFIINYLFTGKEIDEETGLYNFHARLYDPVIGRFYQLDPKGQYFSPYTYVGNSPISLVDPDGEFAITIAFAIASAILGAYLGGASANNRWNPTDWDFKDLNTWSDIVFGAIEGAVLPYGLILSPAIIGTAIGSTVAYISAAQSNQNNWDLISWDWNKPETWNALLQGFGTGSGIVGFSKLPFSFAAKTFSKTNLLGKTSFLAMSFLAGGGLMYGNGVAANDGNAAFWQWNWSNPSTLIAVIDGFDSGFGWLQGFAEIGLSLKKARKKLKSNLTLFQIINPKIIDKVKAIALNVHHPLNRIALPCLVVYLSLASIDNDLPITKLNTDSLTTYEALLNGLFMGKDLPNVRTLVRNAKSKGTRVYKNITYFYKEYYRILKSIIMDKKRDTKMLLIYNFFQNPQPYFDKIKNVDKKQNAVKFYKDGIQQWEKDKHNVPDVLNSIFNSKSAQMLTNINYEIQKSTFNDEQNLYFYRDRQLDVESNIPFLNCGKRSKRVSPNSSLSCTLNSKYDKNATLKFVNNPIEFLRKNAVSQLYYFESRAMTVKMENDKIYKFQIFSDSNSMYHLWPSADNTNEIGIRGKFLSTGKRIRVKLDEKDFNYIFTPELQGCTIYTKYHPDTNELEFYHKYIRYGTANLLVMLDEKNGNSLKYISDQTFQVLENINGSKLFDGNGEQIKPVISDGLGLIPIDQYLYYKNDKNELVKIEKIGNLDIDDFIKRHNDVKNEEIKLLSENFKPIDYRKYMDFNDFDIAVEIKVQYVHASHNQIIPVIGAIPLIYKVSPNEWKFFAQKVRYEINDSNNFRIYKKPVNIPLTPTALQNQINSNYKRNIHSHQIETKTQFTEIASNETFFITNDFKYNSAKSVSSKLVDPLYSFLSYVTHPLKSKWFSITQNINNKQNIKNQFLPDEINYFQHFDINSFLLLANVCVRKFIKSSPLLCNQNQPSQSEVQACALNIVCQVEIALGKICSKYNIHVDNIIFDPISMQSKIVKLLTSCDVKNVEKNILNSIKFNGSDMDYETVNKELKTIIKKMCIGI